MKKILFAISILFSSCQHVQRPSGELMSSNISALEQTIDLDGSQIDTDDILAFDRNVSDLGVIPIGEKRELTIFATNTSNKPVVVLDVYTSCDCTQIAWNKKPIPPHTKAPFKITFTAEQPGTFFKKIAVRHSANTKSVSFAIQGIITKD